MTDEELNQKIERAVSKKTAHKSNKRRRTKTNPYQLWEQLNVETLKKLGYIK